MPGDFSRKIFDPSKHYSGVLMQQGRVQLDADWNEQLDIQSYRARIETKDVIGACGVPKKGNSFKITLSPNGTGIIITSGHIYVGGLLCQLEYTTAATYFNQPYYPNPDTAYFENLPASPLQSPLSPPLQLMDGTYIVYLDAWQREITYLDDPLIREVALGEADTTARLQNVWQVKLLQTQNAAIACKTESAEWDNLIAQPSGKLNVQTITVGDQENACILPPSSGYRRLENQLYRVEVQRGGSSRAATTFKWSRDNASVETTIETVESNILTVADLGKDEMLAFAVGQWVEITDEESELTSNPRPLTKILSVDPATHSITVSTSDIPGATAGRLKLRRWDQSVAAAGENGLPAAAGWIDLEDGIQVSFSEEGNYRAGDYWLIPARTVTGEVEWPPYDIPNLFPEEQSPKGIQHYYCRLAILQVQAGKMTVQDCRPLFPSLTEICAEDICFDNTNCNFPNAKNVQEALDMLCAANDLRTHNKLLHGFGVICGLKMKCRVTRTGVIIEKGSALDCEGNMIQLKNPNGRIYDLVDEAKKNNLLNSDGYGTVCVSIAAGPEPVISIEQYEEKSFWDSVLEGTLLKDFYDQCIKNLIDFFTEKFSFDVTEVVPVPEPQKRLTAFFNLFSQLLNSQSGPYAYISGNSSKQPDEDFLLRQFYNDLKEKLASETFCAMYDGDDPFPDYNVDQGMNTIFGPAVKFHTRLRLHPSAKFAYTCGKNNKIYAYNLSGKELMQVTDFPGSTNISMQDIAVSKKGDELFAAGTLDNNDSVFAVANINTTTGMLQWRTPSTVPGVKIASLGLTPSNKLYATAISKGLFEVTGIGTSTFLLRPVVDFNATGLLYVANDEAHVVAAENNSTTSESLNFNAVRIFNLDGSSNNISSSIPLTGDDSGNDILVLGTNVYVTGKDDSGVRVMGVYDLINAESLSNTVPVDDSSVLRLGAYSAENTGSFVLIAIADACKIVRVALNQDKLEINTNFRIPTQLFPMSMAVDNESQTGFVLNMFVNTITAMNMPQIFHTAPAPNFTLEPPDDLATYRDGVIEAYKDVLSHLLQYLKDCFCDKFLIDCPQCDEDDKVYLGCVEVRNSKVYHICNFGKRKYVKTFRNVEYWLSTVPILPIVNEAFDKLCCTVLDFSRTKTSVAKP